MLRSNSISSRATHRSHFQPDYIAESVDAVDFAYLQQQGVKAVFIDLDGTVVARGTHDVRSSITQALRSQPLNVYIATNRPKSRDLKNLKELLHAQGVIHPHGILGKPFPHYYRTALAEHGYKPDEVVMIGDRYIQDIFGAGSAGLRTLVVHKLDRPTNWFDHLLSGLERRYTLRLSKSYRPLGAK